MDICIMIVVIPHDKGFSTALGGDDSCRKKLKNRTINLAISTAKLTTRSIISGIRKYSQHREKVKAKKARDPAVHGKQVCKKAAVQNQGATNVEIDKSGMKDFERLARKYGVDFAVRKDKSVNPPQLFRVRSFQRFRCFGCYL